MRTAEGLERLRGSTALLPRLVAESALAPPREPRRALPVGLPGRGASSFERHVVVRSGHEPVLEQWS